MKRLLYTILVAMALVGTGCGEDKPVESIMPKIFGEWHCTAEEFSAEAYVAFNEDGTFELYQQVGEGRYRFYDGTWYTNGMTLIGAYSDNSPWGSQYGVAIPNPDTMVLTALNGSNEVMTYVRTVIPESIKENSTTLRSLLHGEDEAMAWF